MSQLIVCAQINDPTDAKSSQPRGSIGNPRHPRTKEHARAAHPSLGDKTPGVTKIQNAGEEIIRPHDATHATGRGGTAYRPAIATRLKALIDTANQLTAVYSFSLSTLPTRLYNSSGMPAR